MSVYKNFEDAKIVNNIVRWKTNDRIPFDDMLQSFYEADLITLCQLHNSNIVRENETKVFLENYRKQMENHVPDAEELFDMKAAFGEGTTVVNVFTGKRIQL